MYSHCEICHGKFFYEEGQTFQVYNFKSVLLDDNNDDEFNNKHNSWHCFRAYNSNMVLNDLKQLAYIFFFTTYEVTQAPVYYTI